MSDRMFCSACQCPFDSREEQTEHYKLDWHRFNLRQRLAGRAPATVEEFESKTGAGDMSSISGSDSEETDSDSDWSLHGDDDTVESESSLKGREPLSRLSARVLFQNAQGQYLSVYRCVLHSKKMGEEKLAASLLSISNKSVWVVLMTGGGHFAGAVFQGKEVLQHKTFHRYTVRAKRGTAQGIRDSQNRSSAPKSAGAALRRYNEAALVKDVQDLLESWSEHLRQASAIFLRAPSYNRSIFFGGRAAPLDKNDPRVRTLPFVTRRATFREVLRVHETLSTVHIYGRNADVSNIFSPSKKVWRRKAPRQEETKPDQEITAPQTGQQEEEDGSSEEEGVAEQLETVEVTLGTLDLREFEVHPNRKRRRRRKEGHRAKGGACREREEGTGGVETASPGCAGGEERPGRSENTQPAEEEGVPAGVWEYGMRDALYTACKVGDVDGLRGLLQTPGGEGTDDEPHGEAPPCALPHAQVDSSGFTFLHVASAAGQRDVVRLLMDAGCDPACRDVKGQTPYSVAPDKDTRNVFRRYMAEHPDKYDYSKAQIPGPLTAEIESKKAEKKRAQKAARKQREKEQKEKRRKQEAELEEKRKFAALSDREKRALAAERRLAQQLGTASELTNIRRCWQCGESLQGKVPFEYLDFSFCTPRCVQQHRKARAAEGKQ
ncbi:ankyrin repeat and zinc finger domain-containing protein 1 [Megalops cyprinoides]|uniref:ankyrin repeat and zinc finger domain-containing protein 1 n=1 Tax=Megalops cyprinoides TaxID=118141 RepID=UPI001864063A|nr:ankyrin repeat and zinc finger domain-containing protein 1 [Megalops cyprinoides]